MNHIQVYLGILLFMVVSCNHKGKRPSGVDDVLQCAGQNRQELEKVLEYYQNDSLKYRAACFLIENMSGHFSYQGEAMEYCKRKLKTLPRQLRSDSMKVFWQQAASMYPDGAFDRIPDCVTIKSAYLIQTLIKPFGYGKRHLDIRRLALKLFVVIFYLIVYPMNSWRMMFIGGILWQNVMQIALVE